MVPSAPRAPLKETGGLLPGPTGNQDRVSFWLATYLTGPRDTAVVEPSTSSLAGNPLGAAESSWGQLGLGGFPFQGPPLPPEGGEVTESP